MQLKEIFVIIVTLILIIGISELLRFFLIKKSEKTKEIPFIIITVLMFVLEIAKQIYYLFVYKDGYPAKVLPFYFSSTFPIVYLLALVTKGEAKRRFRGIAAINSTIAMIGFYLYPKAMIQNAANNLFSNYDSFHNLFTDFHTFYYHHLMFFYAFLSIFLNMYEADPKKDLVYFVAFLLIYSVVGITASYLFKANYNNFRPEAQENIFKVFRNTFGTPLYVTLTTAIFTFASIPALYLYISLDSLINKRIYNSLNETSEINDINEQVEVR